ncbi:hypothetical protein T265_05271, partial [Opisthorchis viverrini]
CQKGFGHLSLLKLILLTAPREIGPKGIRHFTDDTPYLLPYYSHGLPNTLWGLRQTAPGVRQTSCLLRTHERRHPSYRSWSTPNKLSTQDARKTSPSLSVS